MKKILVIAVLLLSVHTAFAQFTIGANVGYNAYKVTGATSTLNGWQANARAYYGVKWLEAGVAAGLGAVSGNNYGELLAMGNFKVDVPFGHIYAGLALGSLLKFVHSADAEYGGQAGINLGLGKVSGNAEIGLRIINVGLSNSTALLIPATVGIRYKF